VNRKHFASAIYTWGARDDLPSTFELRVRTIFMHAYAEPQHNIGYKAASELPGQVRRELAWIAASAYERVRSWDGANDAWKQS
jgi:ppGpp synthetase/RelA/SpoT-type nucleotidyltranferase